MSIAQNYPNLKPSLLLDFSNTEQLDPRITFSRASTATYYGTQTAKAEENLVLQSQDFTAVNWAVLNASVTANTSVAPDGTTTAETYAATASTGQHRLDQTSQSVAGTQRVLSFFVKANTHNFVQLMFGTDIQAFANFNITAGAGAVGTVGSSATASIVDAGNGWYRCIIVTASATASAQAFILLVSSATAARFESWTTAGTESIYLWGAQLEQRSAVTAYTPTTTQTITNYIPVLETAASGVARFDHNPTTFESLGLLIEEQRTNLFTYSEQFDNAAWTKSNLTITANTVVSPDGALTGDKLVSALVTSFMAATQTISVVSGNSYTMTMYVKAGEWRYVYLQVGGASWTSQGQNSGIRFDLISGTVAGAYNGQSTTNGAISNVGNGWFRISAVWTCNLTTAAAAILVGMTNTNNTVASVGDGYSGIFIWGAQLEAGAFPTSYIATVASQVTRSADAAVMTGTNFSSWYNQAQGTLYAEWSSVGSLSDNRIVYALSDGTFNNVNYLTAATAGAANQSVYTIRSSNTSQASIAVSGAYTNYTYRKTADVYKVNDFAISGDGGAVAVDTSGLLPSGVDRLALGTSWIATTSFLGGHIKKVAYYPLRVTNAQLQALTS